MTIEYLRILYSILFNTYVRRSSHFMGSHISENFEGQQYWTFGQKMYFVLPHFIHFMQRWRLPEDRRGCRIASNQSTTDHEWWPTFLKACLSFNFSILIIFTDSYFLPQEHTGSHRLHHISVFHKIFYKWSERACYLKWRGGTPEEEHLKCNVSDPRRGVVQEAVIPLMSKRFLMNFMSRH